jgi:hypothetical protein
MAKKKLIQNFRDLIDCVEDDQIKDEPLLPITHIPKWHKMNDILRAGRLKPFKGSKYYEEEDLIFFTYGRNSFMPKNVRGMANEAMAPIALVFNLQSIGKSPIRILPFDSGGFEFYKLEEGYTPKDFEIPVKCNEDLQKLVCILFRNYRKYLKYEHEFKDLIPSLPAFPQIKGLHSLYETQANTTTEIGKQGRSIELHFDSEILLKPLLVIVPHNYWTDKNGKEQLELMFPGTAIEPYVASGNPYVHLDNINGVLQKYISKQRRKCA